MYVSLGFGVTRHAVDRSVAKPNDITVSRNFLTVSNAKSFASSPQVKEIVQGSGVIGAHDLVRQRGVPELTACEDRVS